MLNRTRIREFVVAALALGLVICTVVQSSSARANDQLSTEWRRWDKSARECIENAERVLKAAQFGNIGFSNDNDKDRTITAERGQYTASVQCVEEMKFVFFIVFGPNDKIAEEYIQELVGRF